MAGSNQGDSWDPTQSKSRQDEVWKRAQDAKRDAEADAKDPSRVKARRRTGWLKIIGGLMVGAVVLVVVAVIFLPAIAGAIAPGLVESRAGDFISGQAKVKKVSLSWSGPQKIENLRVLEKGTEVAKLTVETEAGLLGLISGNLNLGEIRISQARVEIVRDKNGELNLQRILANPKGSTSAPGSSGSSGGGSSSPAKVPKGLKAKLVVDSLALKYVDQSTDQGATVTLSDLDVNATLEAGQPISVKVSAKAAGSDATAGTIDTDIKVERWSADDGTINVKTAKTTSTIAIADLPVALLEAFIPAMPGQSRPQLVAGLGPTLELNVDVTGEMNDLAATVAMNTTGAKVNAQVAWSGGLITATGPVSASVKGQALTALVPAINDSLKGQDALKLDAMPDVVVSLEKLSIPYDPAKALDLRGGAATLTLQTTKVTGQIKLAPDQPAKPFELAPLVAGVQTPDLAKEVKVNANSTLAISGDAAGEVLIDVSTGSVLNADGMPVAGLPPGLQGTANIRNIATALLQPFAASSGLDLPTDLGPTLDVQLTANAGSASGGGVPPTDVSLRVTSRELNVAGDVAVLPSGIEAKPESIRVEIANAGRLASRFVKPETGWALSPTGGTATIAVQGFTLPRAATTNALSMHELETRFAVTLKDIAASPLRPDGSSGGTVSVGEMAFRGEVTGGDARLTLQSALMHERERFNISGDFSIPKVLVPERMMPDGSKSFVADPMSIRPTGQLEVRELPTQIASLFMPPQASQAGGAPAPDMGQTLAGVLGRVMNLTVVSRPVEGAEKVYEMAVNASAARLNAGIKANVSPTELALNSCMVNTTLNQESVMALLAQFAPDIQGAPRLVGDATIDVNVDPVRIPLDSESKPIWLQAGVLNAVVQSAGRTTVDGLTLKNADGTTRQMGRAGIENLLLTVNTPLAVLFGPGNPGAQTATVKMSGKVIGPAEREIMTLSADGAADLKAAKPAGPAVLTAKVTGVDALQLDQVLGQNGMVSGVLGETASLDLSARLTPPTGSSEAFSPQEATIDVVTSIQATNLDTTGPLKARISPDGIVVAEPAQFALRVAPSFANPLLESKPKPGEPSPSAASQLRMTAPATLTLKLDSVKVPRKEGQPFDIKAGVLAPSLNFETGDGKALAVSALSLRLATDNSRPSPPLTFALDVASASVDQYATQKPLKLQGLVENVIGQDGAMDFAKGLLTMGGTLEGIPVALLDAVAKKDGLLVDALGQTVDVIVTAEKVPLEGLKGQAGGPAIMFKANAARASADVQGVVRDNVFVANQPVKVDVLEVTKALAARYIGSVPVIETLEKTPNLRPANVTATNLTVPLGNDMSQLNGQIVLDPGELNFELSNGFAKLIGDRVVKTRGVLGQRLQPLNTTITNGVGTLERYKFAIGEFAVELEGDVDLVRERVDIVTWIPATMLADEAVGSIAGILPGGNNPLLGASDFISAIREFLPMVPYRTKGPLNSPTPSLLPDADLIVREFQKSGGVQKVIERALKNKGGNLLDPGKLFKLPGSGGTPSSTPTPPPPPR